ncbi:MAG: hypothetical protein HYV35_12370 [Lentisphaerae bacterium]|nr:hypothetical protein [Lentisphaerota bacterium]
MNPIRNLFLAAAVPIFHRGCRVLAVLLVLALLPVAEVRAQDADGDLMPDSFELFYGLDPSTNDAALDYDGDNLSNLQESAPDLLTDPFAPDTDMDDWRDDFDAVISRAYLPFGVPLFTHGDFCDYARPDWVLGGAWKMGGEWITNPPAWRVDGSESNSGAGLLIAVDRGILTNNLIYALHYEGRAGQPVPPSNSVGQSSSFFVDLLDTNGLVVAENLYGNLLTSSNAEVVVFLAVPTAIFPGAAIIRLRHGEGELDVYEGLVYISEDGDELDADQERQLGTSDYAIDSNGNGISDYMEWLNSTGGGSSTNDPGGGGGGSTNNTDGGTSAPTGVIFVSQSIGSDSLTGRAPEVRGSDGPKKTISKGLAAVEQDGAHTLIIKSGAYGEDLDLRGKHLKVVIEGRVKL